MPVQAIDVESRSRASRAAAGCPERPGARRCRLEDLRLRRRPGAVRKRRQQFEHRARGDARATSLSRMVAPTMNAPARAVLRTQADAGAGRAPGGELEPGKRSSSISPFTPRRSRSTRARPAPCSRSPGRGVAAAALRAAEVNGHAQLPQPSPSTVSASRGSRCPRRRNAALVKRPASSGSSAPICPRIEVPKMRRALRELRHLRSVARVGDDQGAVRPCPATWARHQGMLSGPAARPALATLPFAPRRKHPAGEPGAARGKSGRGARTPRPRCRAGKLQRAGKTCDARAMTLTRIGSPRPRLTAGAGT